MSKFAFLIDDILLETNSLNIYLSSLITTHLKQSITEKQVNDSLFQTSTVMLILLIGMIFLFITMVLLIIINHFQNLHNYLEENILIKTKELREPTIRLNFALGVKWRIVVKKTTLCSNKQGSRVW